MNAQYDVPMYPQLGHVYPGDYYEALPFDDYIDRAQPLPSGENVFDIRDFGAVPEKERLNTEAFRAAARACEQAGGGTILVAGGSYWMGAVHVPSNTTLFIAADSEIVASRNMAHMGEAVDLGGQPAYAFVHIANAENVVVTGGGRISGNGEWYVYEPREKPSLTPFPITALPRTDQAAIINDVPGTLRYFYRRRIRYAEDHYYEGLPPLSRPNFMVWARESHGVRFENIVLHASMCWTLNLDRCEDVTVRNLVIDDNRHVANTDGIDVTGSSRVSIEHCFISCADDGIVLKNPQHTGCAMSDVSVKDCTVVTVMSAFKIGTETGHDIADVRVEDCRFCMPDIYPGSVTGISLESCDGTHLRNVVIRNIEMERVNCPLYICLNMRNHYHDPYTDETGRNRFWGGAIENIVIENVRAVNAETPSILTGFQTARIDGTPVRRAVRNVHLRDFHVKYRENPAYVNVPEVTPEHLFGYPESNAHGDVDASGIWARHIDGLALEEIDITPRAADNREIIRLHDVR